jgi:hypothetical protein
MEDKKQQEAGGFKELLGSMMRRRWFITALVLGSFMMIIVAIFIAVSNNATMAGEWKELLMLLLGAFIGSYGKIIDYWFSDTDKDKMLVQKMDEEDGTTLSHTNDMKESNKPYAPTIPDAFVKAAERASDLAVTENKQKFELSKDEQEHRQVLEADQQEHKQEMEKLEFLHHEHKQCEHVFADVDHDGDYECIHCGKIKDDHC